jgi:hypothetical protein
MSITTGLGREEVGYNYLINGAMEIAQRGVSFTPVSSLYSLDRWNVWRNTTTQSTDVPSNSEFKNSIQHVITSVSSGQFSSIEQKVESELLLAGKKLTLSFWIKGSVAGTLVARHYSQSNNVGFGHTSFSITTSWNRVSIPVTVPTIGGGTKDWCAFGIDFNVNTPPATLGYAGSGVTPPTYVGTVNITGMKLEVGSVATPFSLAGGSIGGELVLCQRYYTQVTADARGWFAGYSTSTSSGETGFIQFPVEMRIAPIITLGTASNFRVASSTTYGDPLTITAQTISAKKFAISFTHAATLTTNRVLSFGLVNGADFLYTASAEL